MSLPKAELHVHIEGTLEPEQVFDFAERNGVELPFADVDDLRARYRFDDLVSFLDLYYSCMTVLRTRRDFRELVEAYAGRAHAQGVRHVEAFFDPQVHTGNGVPLDVVLDGLTEGLASARERYGMTGGLILCFLRDRPVGEAADLLEEIAPRAGELLGVGLDSAEVGFPPALFSSVFTRAAALGLHRVAHAGEEGPAAYITDALDELGVERIDHGVKALEDEAVVDRLRTERIPLTVCPLSTLRLGGVRSLDEHALPRLVDAGLVVTINSDDPAYFGGYVGDAFLAIAEALDVDPEAAAGFAAASIEASFADDGRKAELRAELAEWRAREL